MAEENKENCSGSCSSCGEAGTCQSKKSPYEPMNAHSHIKNVIAVVSGKGGVGKSMATASIARELVKKGFKVGILDADITGPSIPKMYGIHNHAKGSDTELFPAEAEDGTKIMSINLLLPEEESPVIWRGPILAGVVKQFWSDVCWGELDYLLIDLPPGTGDVPLTVFQSIPVTGCVIVTSPQDLVRMIVQKAYNMADKMGIRVLGIVENFSYLICPDCGKRINVFGESDIDTIAAQLGLPVMAKIPIDPKISGYVEAERFWQIDMDYMEGAVKYLPEI